MARRASGHYLYRVGRASHILGLLLLASACGEPAPATGSGAIGAASAVWSRTIDGPGEVTVLGVAVGPDGSVVVTGWFEGFARFDDNVVHTSSNLQPELFVAKYDASGELSWTRTYGWPGLARGRAVAIDPESEDIVVVGEVTGPVDFGVLPPAGVRLPAGDSDAFVLRLDPDGESLWVAQVGGAGSDGATAVTIDARGFVYVTGHFQGTANFHPEPVLGDLRRGVGGFDAFLLKLSRERRYLWTRTFVGPGDVFLRDVRLTPDRFILLGGDFTDGVDFNPGAFDDTRFAQSPFGDGFVVRLLLEGQFSWVHTLGAPLSPTSVRSVDADAAGSIYAAGTFGGRTELAPGTLREPEGLSDAFLVRLDRLGSPLWGRGIGASERATGPLVRTQDLTAVLAGAFARTLTVAPGGVQVDRPVWEAPDAFVAAIDRAGFSRSLFTFGGPGEVRVHHLAVGEGGERVLVGDFLGTIDLPGAAGLERRTAFGGRDAFIVRVR